MLQANCWPQWFINFHRKSIEKVKYFVVFHVVFLDRRALVSYGRFERASLYKANSIANTTAFPQQIRCVLHYFSVVSTRPTCIF